MVRLADFEIGWSISKFGATVPSRVATVGGASRRGRR
jgi:hypothetical protein